MKPQRVLGVGIVASVAVAGLAACSSSGGSSAGSGPAQVSPPAIQHKGQITWCSDLSAPPMEYYDNSHKPTGLDVDVANEIARRMGVSSKWRDTKFAGIIPTLIAKQCDAIQSELYVKPERARVVDFLPYLKSGQSILVRKGNPKKISGLDDTLCGKHVSTTISTTAYELIKTQSGKCTAAGKSGIEILRFQADVDALQQLALGRSDAYATTSETAAYYLTKQKNTYEFVGGNYATVTAGIAVKKGNAKLLAAMQKAFAAMRSDGTYAKILKRYQLDRNANG
jgi:polar amino acid transport system substrate-binding protein